MPRAVRALAYRGRMHEQLATDGLGTPLSHAVFVVVDLETTGGAPADAGITEIGAVKVCGGEVIGEFATLVNPGVPIPPFVAALTGITDALVASAPRLGAVLPSFLEFARGAILVAHNAPYDIGFLKGACARLQVPWPGPTVLDTARIARIALHRDEVRNCKLATLAAHFRTEIAPSHRAFDDARATADVLHALIGRVGDLGVTTVEDLQAFTSRVSRQQRAKRHLAEHLPSSPGVYVFRDPAGVPLYVGTSRNIKARVRGYFTASETRRRMSEMVGIAKEVTAIECATPLEARVRELRLIAEFQPRYNHRSKRPEKQVWLKLTVEPAPRLSVVGAVLPDHDDGARYLGPFPGAGRARAVADALTAAFAIRTCTTRLARQPRAVNAGCVLHELGRCAAPCMRDHDAQAYAEVIDEVRTAMDGDIGEAVRRLTARMAELADAGRFEEAAQWRDRIAALAAASVHRQRIGMLAGAEEIVAAAQTADGGWEIHCIRHGMLAGAAEVRRGADPSSAIEALLATAEHVVPTGTCAPAGLTEEADAIWHWLCGARLVRVSAPLAMPRHAGGAESERLARVRRFMRDLPEGDDDYRWVSRYARANESRPHGPRELPVTRIATA